MAFSAVAVLNLAVMSNNIAGRTKQVVASSFVFVAWAVGNAVGPQVFRADDAPRYVRAFVAHMVVYGVQVVVLFALRGYLMRLNVLKRRAAADADAARASGEPRVSFEAGSYKFCAEGGVLTVLFDARAGREHRAQPCV